MIGRSQESLQQHLGSLADTLRASARDLDLMADGLLDFVSSYDEARDDPEAVDDILPMVDRTIDRVHMDCTAAARRADLMTRP